MQRCNNKHVMTHVMMHVMVHVMVHVMFEWDQVSSYVKTSMVDVHPSFTPPHTAVHFKVVICLFMHRSGQCMHVLLHLTRYHNE